ncbi:hypothetical protein H1Q63_34475 [Desmonostoc muscorum CCALA 125]|nr:hypothetical protein [Desmonostoc muscorum CCALA 125]
MTNQTFTNGYALLIGVGAGLPVTVKDVTAIGDILIDSDRPTIHQYNSPHEALKFSFIKCKTPTRKIFINVDLHK